MFKDWPGLAKALSAPLKGLRGGAEDTMKAFSGMAQAALKPGALDVKTGIVVLDAIARINRELGTLTVVITHNASIANMADRVVYLSDGRIAEIKTNKTKTPAAELVW